MRKLQELGIVGKLLEWIRSLLTGRRQRVHVDGIMSEWIEITSGIPQGSVLGFILFNFINDMPGKVIFNTCKLFADNSKLYGSVNMQRDLDELVNVVNEVATSILREKMQDLTFLQRQSAT